MDDSLQMNKGELQIQNPQSHAFREELDNKEEMKGFEAYLGGETKNRVTRSIERLQRHTKLTDEQIETLKNSVTEEPRFGTEEGAEFTQLLKPEQKKKLGYFKKKRYNKKESAYKKQLGAWELKNMSRIYNQENKVYMAFKNAEESGKEVGVNIESDAQLYEYNNLITEEKAEKKAKAAEEAKGVEDVEAVVNEMDKLFMDHTNAENKVALDQEQAQEDEKKIEKAGVKYEAKRYTNEGFSKYNSYFRKMEVLNEVVTDEDEKEAEALKAGLKKCRNDKTFVVNRGVNNINVLYKMLGLPPLYRKVDEDNIEEVMEDAIKHLNDLQSKGKDVILSDPGFVSTSTDAQNSFASPMNIENGIEFVIKVNKGTSCANLSNFSKFGEENELLLNAGTKFRLIKVYSCGKVQYDGLDYRPPSYATANNMKEENLADYSLKIYLETIPDSEDGVLKKK